MAATITVRIERERGSYVARVAEYPVANRGGENRELVRRKAITGALRLMAWGIERDGADLPAEIHIVDAEEP